MAKSRIRAATSLRPARLLPGRTPFPSASATPASRRKRPTTSTVLFEHYINPFGLIAAGYFYKNLTDPIVSQIFTVATGTIVGANCSSETQGCKVFQPINAGSAWINGLEAAYLQHWSSLPGILGGLGLSANYGYTASRTSGFLAGPITPGSSAIPQIAGISARPLIAAASLFESGFLTIRQTLPAIPIRTAPQSVVRRPLQLRAASMVPLATTISTAISNLTLRAASA